VTDEAPEQSSKTEDPSERKLREAHKRGDVVKSQEVNTWFLLTGAALVFFFLAGPSSEGLVTSLRSLVANADQYEIGGPALTEFWWRLSGGILMVAVVPLLVLALFAVAGNLVQHMPLLSIDPIIPGSPRSRRSKASSGCSRSMRWSILPRGW
jgi:flagellar biosynthetic protein FlhB